MVQIPTVSGTLMGRPWRSPTVECVRVCMWGWVGEGGKGDEVKFFLVSGQCQEREGSHG